MKFIKACRLGSDQEILLNLTHIEHARAVEQDGGYYVVILQTTTGNSYSSRDTFSTARQAEQWFMSELTETPPETRVRIVPQEPQKTPVVDISHVPLEQA